MDRIDKQFYSLRCTVYTPDNVVKMAVFITSPKASFWASQKLT